MARSKYDSNGIRIRPCRTCTGKKRKRKRKIQPSAASFNAASSTNHSMGTSQKCNRTIQPSAASFDAASSTSHSMGTGKKRGRKKKIQPSAASCEAVSSTSYSITLRSLRKRSSGLTTRSVDLRNSTKLELASNLTDVLAEYRNIQVAENTAASSVQIKTESQAVPEAMQIVISNPRTVEANENTASVPLSPRGMNAAENSSNAAPPEKLQIIQSMPQGQFANINLPEVGQYQQIYGHNLNVYQNVPTIAGIASFPAAIPSNNSSNSSIIFPQIVPQTVTFPLLPQYIQQPHLLNIQPTAITIPTSVAQGSRKPELSKSSSLDDKEDGDTPLAFLLGHPDDRVLEKNINKIVQSTNLQDITMNKVIQKIYDMYPKFDLSYRKEFIKSTLRSILYKLGNSSSAMKVEVKKKPITDTNSSTHLPLLQIKT